jgi:hypothetical protein
MTKLKIPHDAVVFVGDFVRRVANPEANKIHPKTGSMI